MSPTSSAQSPAMLWDVFWARQRGVGDLTHARQRINAMVLRYGLHYPKDVKWTLVHHDWLTRQRLEPATSQQAFAAEMEIETLLMAYVKRFDVMIAELAGYSEASPIIDTLMCLRGISVTTGFGLAVEIGDWTRFTGFLPGTDSVRAFVWLIAVPGGDHESREHVCEETFHRGSNVSRPPALAARALGRPIAAVSESRCGDEDSCDRG